MIEPLYILKDGQYVPSNASYCTECRYAVREGEECFTCRVRHCSECRIDMGKYVGYTCCEPCRVKLETARQEKIFTKAKKVTPEEYDGGMVYMEEHDRWFSYIEEALDYIDEAIEDGDLTQYPRYLWGSTPQKPSFNADWVIDHICQDAFEDYDSQVVDFDELDKFITEWCSKQPTYFEVDYSTAILLETKPRRS